MTVDAPRAHHDRDASSRRLGGLIALLLAAVPLGAQADPIDHASSQPEQPRAAPAGKAPSPKPAPRPVCAVLADAAAQHRLPFSFFARLIWQESRFHPLAVSPAGAQGIAQFMPATAAERTLADPFVADNAISASAALLEDLNATFGSLGLAAAAYNAGPGRVSRWLAGAADLPAETLAYVKIVTGHEADEWRRKTLTALPDDPAFSCAQLEKGLAALPPGSAARDATRETKDWAVILLGNPQRPRLVAEYDMIKGQFSKVLGFYRPSIVFRRVPGLREARYLVEIEQDSRGEADGLCSRLLRAGGNCFVLRTGTPVRPKMRAEGQTATAVGGAR